MTHPPSSHGLDCDWGNRQNLVIISNSSGILHSPKPYIPPVKVPLNQPSTFQSKTQNRNRNLSHRYQRFSQKKCRHRPETAARSGELSESGKCCFGGATKRAHPTSLLDTWQCVWAPAVGGLSCAPLTWTTLYLGSCWCKRRRNMDSATMAHLRFPVTRNSSKTCFGSWPDPNASRSQVLKISRKVATSMSEGAGVLTL